jgi:hypothetical protein
MSLNNPTPKEKRIIRIAGGAVGATILIASLSQLEGILASIAYIFLMLFYLFSAPLKVDVTCTLPENTIFVGTTDTGASFTLDTADNSVIIESDGDVMTGEFSWDYGWNTKIWFWDEDTSFDGDYDITSDDKSIEFISGGTIFYDENLGIIELNDYYGGEFEFVHAKEVQAAE